MSYLSAHRGIINTLIGATMENETRLALIEAEQIRMKKLIDGNGKPGLYDMAKDTQKAVELTNASLGGVCRQMKRISNVFWSIFGIVASTILISLIVMYGSNKIVQYSMVIGAFMFTFGWDKT